MTAARITRALASRWALGVVIALGLLAGWRVLGPGVAVVATIGGLAVLAYVRDTAAQDAEEARDLAIDREGRAMARAAVAEARALAAEATACPLCSANRRAAELARKVAS